MSTQLNMQELKAAIAESITPVITESGNYLEEVSILPAGKSRILTVIVDSDTHLNLDQVTSVSREISQIVETLEVLGDQPFTLEVTSPGIDRPLTLPRHWRKNHGRLVKATLLDGATVSGRIGQASDTSVEIDQQSIELDQIKKALIEIEFKSLKSEASDLGDDE